jgi:ABC-type amino acid transport substrate-binding protein
MKARNFFLTTLLSAAVAFGVGTYAVHSSSGKTKETALERIKRTGSMKCGYIPWAPYFSIDPNTKEKSGIAHEFMQSLGRELDIKIEWAEETGYGNFHEGLNSGRYDALCSMVFESGQRAKIALLTDSLFDNGLYAFGRADDARLAEGLPSLNNKDIIFLTVEGDVSQVIKKHLFPDAKEMALPQMVDMGQYYLSVATKKADAGFSIPYGLNQFNKGEGQKLRLVNPAKPSHIFGNVIAVKLGETDLKLALDSAITAIKKNGDAASITQKYEGFF